MTKLSVCVNDLTQIWKLSLRSLLYLFTSIEIQYEVLVASAGASVSIPLGEIVVWFFSTMFYNL